ncbi:hypothetical protein [Methylobacterium brachythecii]|uniref:Uncharacterized protein n=1 Tax=Methylobacterium brachythecii TaxID=1176177 RepID=A0A7W6F9G0_9HYPH|nr:hypothetical protein [Methylobacterium brachythecii]MBB3905121.1 hypothetical protein [Methylobacterium brachythecii]GLS44371.1 hypothetical protein GCM10007884_23590 [Methylobacterium brachythecii]
MSGYSTGLTVSQVSQAAAAAVASSSAILDGSFTVDTLPDPAANLDRYARVTDLFGVKRDLVLASIVNGVAFWQPVRPVYAAKQTITADMTLTALKTPSVLLLDGTIALGATRKLTLSPTLAFPGASFRLKHRTSLGSILGTLQVLNINLGTPISILTGGTFEAVYDMTDGWVQVT